MPASGSIGRAAALWIAVLVMAPPGAAQLVDPSGAWRTLHTAHFRLHFRPAYQAAALEAAREAERAYALLSAELHPPRGVIDLTLSDDADAANGFASIYPSNRLTIYLAPPTSDPALQHYDIWLRFLLVHELTHLFHLDRARGFWGALQTIFGRAPGLFPNTYQPSWVTEGLATYYESTFSRGGRVTGAHHPPLLAAEAHAGAPRSRADALMFTKWPNGSTPYAYGGAFFNHLARSVGDSMLPRFIEATAKQLIPFRVGRQLERVGAGDVRSDWAAAVETTVQKGTTAHPLAGEEILLDALWSDPVARLSPDGRRVAYLHDDGKDAPRLVIADAGTLGTLRERGVTGGVSHDWAGDTLVVAQLDFTDRWRLRSDLYLWLPDGRWQRATSGGRTIEPRSGGGRTVWITLDGGETAPSIGGVAPVGSGDWGTIVPSPDGRWMAATRHYLGRWRLVRWAQGQPDTLSEVLDGGGGVVSEPVWGARNELYVVWAPDGLPQVYRIDERGTTRVTAALFGARSPAPLPDGTMLYSTQRAGGWALARAPMVGNAAAPDVGDHAAAIDSAPPVEIRETGYSGFQSLLPRFWLPAFASEGHAGFFFGAQTAGQDALARYSYFTRLMYSADPSRAAGAFVIRSNILRSVALDAGAAADWSDAGQTRSGRQVSSLEHDVWLGATIEWRRWRSAAALRLAVEYEGDSFDLDPDSAVAPRKLAGGYVTLAFGHAIAAPLAVSAQRGFGFSGSYRRREELGSARWSDRWQARGTLYLPFPDLGTFAHPVVMVRGAAGVMLGPLIDRFEAGGVPSTAFDVLGIVGVEAGAGSFYVRGYPEEALRGTRAIAAGVEVRIPLLLVGRSIGTLPFGVDMVSLSMFTDAGDAWDDGQPVRLSHLHSIGAELVTDVTINYDSHLRTRVGVAQPLQDGSPQYYLALGTPF
jgi:hypothetical protein